jgi:hypothetical protein
MFCVSYVNKWIRVTCVYMYVIYIHMLAFWHMNLPQRICALYVCMHVCVHIHMHTHTHTQANAPVQVCLCVRVFACTCVR